MVQTEAKRPRVYGNYRTPTSKGLAGLSTAGTALLLAGVIGAVILIAMGHWTGALVFVGAVLLLVLLSTLKDKHGRPLIERMIRRARWANTVYTGANVYRSGPVSRVPGGATQLPGISARSTVSEHADGYGRRFALIRVPQSHHYTVVLGSEPDTGGLVDAEQIDTWVDRWSAWLGTLADDPTVAAAGVTIETAPDSGYRLSRRVNDRLVDDAPEFARRVVQEAVDGLPVGSTTTRAYVSITFKAASRSGGKFRSADEVANDLAARLPTITQTLSATGAGVAEALTAQELCEVITTAYDPRRQAQFDALHARGQAPKLSWSEVGPQAADTFWDCYHHSLAWSKSWSMSVPPRSTVQANVLQSLVAPSHDMLRKRVTLLFRPIDPATAASLVEQDVNTATFNASSRNRETARDTRETRAARATAAEEADGAALLNFGLIVTATVAEKADLPDAAATVGSLSGAAKIRLEEAFGAQDSTFAAGLPLGIVIPDHLKLPAAVRNAL